MGAWRVQSLHQMRRAGRWPRAGCVGTVTSSRQAVRLPSLPPCPVDPHLARPSYLKPEQHKLHSTPLHAPPHHSTPLHTTPHHSTLLHTCPPNQKQQLEPAKAKRNLAYCRSPSDTGLATGAVLLKCRFRFSVWAFDKSCSANARHFSSRVCTGGEGLRGILN